jgi:hypothetical protein
MAETRDIVKWVVMGGGIAVVVFVILPAVLCLGVCGACVGGTMALTQGAETVTQDFFADLRAGNVDAAYGRTSQTYQSAHTLDAFRQAVEDIPVSTGQTAVTVAGRNVNAGQKLAVSLDGSLATDRGPVPIEIRCVNIGQSWFVDAVTIQGVAL